MSLAQKALEIAIKEIGVLEVPRASNKGPVEKYLKSIGLGGGYSYCQAFVYWCYQQASKELNLPNPVVKTGGVLNCWNTTKALKIEKKDIKSKLDLIVPGSQIIYDFGKGLGHTGIIKSIKGDTFITIEGNSAPNSSTREGLGVFEKNTRKITDSLLKGIIVY